MRVRLAVLPIVVLIVSSCGSATETALVTVEPEAGEGVVDGWSMPVELTISRNGERFTSFALAHPMDIELRAGSYVFAVYGKGCPKKVKLHGDIHVLLQVILHDQPRCEMRLRGPLLRASTDTD
jgi:hypothetical protein